MGSAIQIRQRTVSKSSLKSFRNVSYLGLSCMELDLRGHIPAEGGAALSSKHEIRTVEANSLRIGCFGGLHRRSSSIGCFHRGELRALGPNHYCPYPAIEASTLSPLLVSGRSRSASEDLFGSSCHWLLWSSLQSIPMTWSPVEYRPSSNEIEVPSLRTSSPALRRQMFSPPSHRFSTYRPYTRAPAFSLRATLESYEISCFGFRA